MDNKFCFGVMRREASALQVESAQADARASDSERRTRTAPRTRWARLASVVLLSTAYGCSSGGSDFGSGGTTGMPAGGSPSTNGGSAPTAGDGMGGGPAPVGGMNTGGTGNEGNVPVGGTNPSGGMSPTAGTGPGPTGGTNTGGTAPVAGTGGAPPTGGSGGTPQGPACPKPAGQVCHEFFANDNSRNIINYVNEFEPSKSWSKSVNDTTVNSPRQVDMVDNPMGAPFAGSTTPKAILISVNKGYQEYHPVTGARLVNVVLAGANPDVRGAVRLPGPEGNTALAVGNDLLRIVSPSGATVRECRLPGTSASDSLRVLNRDAMGNFYFGRLLEIHKMTETCQPVWNATLPSGSKAYAVLPKPDGGVWATTGAPSTVVAFNEAKAIVGQVGGKTVHPSLNLDFFSGFELLQNGNIVAANWLGHNGSPGQNTPHLVEFSPDNKVVWTWGNQMLARQITNTLMIR